MCVVRYWTVVSCGGFLFLALSVTWLVLGAFSAHSNASEAEALWSESVFLHMIVVTLCSLPLAIGQLDRRFYCEDLETRATV